MPSIRQREMADMGEEFCVDDGMERNLQEAVRGL